MRIEVQLEPAVAQDLQRRSSGAAGKTRVKSATAQLLKQTSALGVTLLPVHPGQVHPLLAPYYFVDVPDRTTAQQVIAQLNKLDAVEGAYLGPEPELP
jgi:hypothetical protein